MSRGRVRLPGLQDITASVDFTALAEAGTGAGFDLAGLLRAGQLPHRQRPGSNLAAAEARAQDEAAVYRLRQEAKHLTLPGEMGERFQVMGFQRDVEFGVAFLAGDLSWRL
jgi:SAM-dependent MidA family methyltransferase